MEFYLPVGNIDKTELSKVFARHYPAGHDNAVFAEAMSSLQYQMDEGFINGSIDLVFEYDSRFYVLDWKSNHLGNSAENYDSQTVKKKVTQEFYFLQYHLYSLALHCHLERSLPNYDYEIHFGGVFYAFIRGFKNGSDYGIHWDRLSREMIEDFKSLFMSKEVEV